MIGNRNEDLLRQEFKRRYLTEFASYVGGLMEESGGSSVNFSFMLVTLLFGAVSMPVAGLLAVGISARYAQVGKGVKTALCDAAEQVAVSLESEDRTRLPHVESWLDGHMEELPGYLDRLDRIEDERRAVKALIARVNRLGSTESLLDADRALLGKHGVRSLKLPLQADYPLAPRCYLGNRHFSQLDRALWSDISKAAGGRGRMLYRMIGLSRA